MSDQSEWVTVPREIPLSVENAEGIEFIIGNMDDGYNEATLFVGTVTDDDGSEQHGLAIRSAEYPEEGAIMLYEFASPPAPAAKAAEPVAQIIRESDGSLNAKWSPGYIPAEGDRLFLAPPPVEASQQQAEVEALRKDAERWRAWREIVRGCYTADEFDALHDARWGSAAIAAHQRSENREGGEG